MELTHGTHSPFRAGAKVPRPLPLRAPSPLADTHPKPGAWPCKLWGTAQVPGPQTTPLQCGCPRSFGASPCCAAVLSLPTDTVSPLQSFLPPPCSFRRHRCSPGRPPLWFLFAHGSWPVGSPSVIPQAWKWPSLHTMS